MATKQDETTPKADAETSGSISHTAQPHISGLSIAARLAQFWCDRPSLWFGQIEAIVAPSRPSDEMKYQYVIANLERPDLEQVSDILLSPPVTDKSGAVKARLLQVYEESQELRLQRLVEGIELGDAQPTQLLRRISLLRLSGSSGTPDAVLQVIWLSKLPSHVRAVLSAVTGDLNNLAQIADKVIGHCHPRSEVVARIIMLPWKKVALTDEQLQVIYREWGVFYTHKQKLDIAANYYDVSLKLKNDPKALYHRSRCKRSIGQTEGALHDARAAMASDPLSQPFTLEVCDALYQLNEFEKSKCELFNNSLKFKGLKLTAFHNRSDVLDENFNATVGDTLGPFILEKEKYFHKALEELNRKKNVDKRPLWKILREQDSCDVLSILEEEKELISPREIARRNRAFNVSNQIYMRRGWIDVLFLKALKSDPSLLLRQSQWSRPLLEQLTQNKYDLTMRFLEMLHARSPLYTEKVRKCPNKELAEKKTQDHLFRVQYQIHRNMLTYLKKMRYIRELKKVEKLSKYIEEVMGDYVVLKTRRVMPWKFEFLNEVYNLLALAHIDKYVDTPKNLTDFRQDERLNVLLKMPKEKDKEPLTFVFGDKSTYQDEDFADIAMIRHKKFMTRMERRILFSKHSIEKSYVWHEIARNHLKNARFDECCVATRKSIEEAKKCNNLVWTLLGLLLTCKSHAVLRKIEKIHDTLLDAIDIAKRLKNGTVMSYIELLRDVNDQDAEEKKLQEEIRRTKSRLSMLSSTGNSSIASSNRS